MQPVTVTLLCYVMLGINLILDTCGSAMYLFQCANLFEDVTRYGDINRVVCNTSM